MWVPGNIFTSQWQNLGVSSPASLSPKELLQKELPSLERDLWPVGSNSV